MHIKCYAICKDYTLPPFRVPSEGDHLSPSSSYGMPTRVINCFTTTSAHKCYAICAEYLRYLLLLMCRPASTSRPLLVTALPVRVINCFTPKCHKCYAFVLNTYATSPFRCAVRSDPSPPSSSYSIQLELSIVPEHAECT
ncbi:hypothetical protein AVEN_125392-1 [Araneus ventricosus]|uniref:Uncharacterized protein n=1 Tax=Araneus ventricosus TaxID=182803 RepID=A0A4Y2M6S3_ARAVE|nr:hypothetical protein AVEN_125392-1 [Araneus ventricosus]